MLQFYRDRMGELRRLILQEQKRTKDKSVPSAFVTFKCAPSIPLSLLFSSLLLIEGTLS